MAKKDQLSWSALAKELGTTRRSLQAWRNEYGEACPQDRSPEKWNAFMREHGIGHFAQRLNAPAAPPITDDSFPPADAMTERELRLREWKLRLDKAEFDLSRAKAQMLPVAEFEVALGVMVEAFHKTGNALPGRAAAKIAARARAALLNLLREKMPAKSFEKLDKVIEAAPIDFADIVEILEDEWNLVVRTLERCDYLEEKSGT